MTTTLIRIKKYNHTIILTYWKKEELKKKMDDHEDRINFSSVVLNCINFSQVYIINKCKLHLRID